MDTSENIYEAEQNEEKYIIEEPRLDEGKNIIEEARQDEEKIIIEEAKQDEEKSKIEEAKPNEGKKNMVSNDTKKKKSSRNHLLGCYKLAVVCLGLVCVLLIITIIVLWLKATADTNQIQTMYDNLTRETELLQSRYQNLTRESSQFQDRFTDRFNTVADENEKLQKRLCHPKMEILQYEVDVSLDPDTAENNLMLSADGKRVWHVASRQNITDSPKRFDPVVCVLGKDGFNSGRFYYEVQVSGKTAWILGVARESINRKGRITVSPQNGHWAIWLKNGDEYKALAGPSILLSLEEKPERVGVFVDYEAGLVSFYDADRWDLIYSFTDVSFNDTIYPLFSPFSNNDNQNSPPLIIIPPLTCPVSK